MSIPEIHKREAPKEIKAAILTISTEHSRKKGDQGGDLVELLLKNANLLAVERSAVSDDEKAIAAEIRRMAEEHDLVVTTGGTGLGKDDVTIKAASKLFDKEISAFRIMFAMLSSEEIGSSALMSNAAAGLVGKCAVFCLPGSPDACRLALEELIIPEIRHIKQQVMGTKLTGAT